MADLHLARVLQCSAAGPFLWSSLSTYVDYRG